MTALLTAAQMRAIEQAGIDIGEVTGLELMERAGAGVVEAIFEWQPELADGDRRAVVLCGPGNNGGDGFVVARLLKQRGWKVEVFLYGDEAKLPPDAAENCRRWREMGGVEPLKYVHPEDTSSTVDLLIDAIFGIGLSRPLSSELCHALQCWEGAEKVAIDCPSGLDADSGKSLRENPEPGHWADLSVTFFLPKHGHYLADGPIRSRELRVADIGLHGGPVRRAIASSNKGHRDYVLLNKAEKLLIPSFERERLFPEAAYKHKYAHGHALIVSGGMAKTGAARLAARGALRIGAGLVTVASPPNALMENAAHLTAIMLQKMKGPEGLADILSDGRINAVVIGPGCGIGDETRALVHVALNGKRTVILDADALTSFADTPVDLFEAIKASSCDVVLTPHGGEFARLFPDLAEKLAEPPTKGPAYSKVDAAREAATRSGATVLFKGADTVIATPEGRCTVAAAVYERAAPWLATAGSGDVLAGMIAGLAARGELGPGDAATSAAWLHQECGRHLGPGLIAEDIPEAIPTVLKRVLDWEPPNG